MDKKPAPRKTPAKKAAPKSKAPLSRVRPTDVPRDNHGTPADKPKAPRKKPAAKPAAAPKKRAPPAKRAAKAPSPALADTKKPKAKTADEPQLGLTPKQQRFVEEYLVDMNATQSAIRAGYSADTAGSIGHENLKKPEIQLALQEARRAQQERTAVTADMVLERIALIAFADTRELVEGKKGCCRHCWGEGHKRQRTVGELNSAMKTWLEKGNNPAEFDHEGGIGYNPHRPPHPECPDCMGDGYLHVVVKDTRLLSPAAAALYAGIKQTKDGFEVKTHSQMDALEKLAKKFGLYEADNRQKGDALASLLNRIATENSNGFKAVPVDPEHPDAGGNALGAVQEPPHGDHT